MLRLLIAVALVACGGSSQPTASDEAGKVIELTGKVTATRDNTTRTLALGNPVASSDVIATAADSSVVIELAHNHARWSLEAGITSRVDASVAWSLPMQDQAKAVDHATSSAGRHAEREAADTQATAKRMVESEKTERASEQKANSQNDADREAAKARLEALRRQQADMQERAAAAKDAAAKAERRKGVKISKECMDNPLARGCDVPADEVADAIARIANWADEMCACTDAACGKAVDARHMPWHVARDKRIPPASPEGKRIALGSLASLQRYEACKAKLR